MSARHIAKFSLTSKIRDDIRLTMSTAERISHLYVSQDDYKLSQELIGEVGLTEPVFTSAGPVAKDWCNPDLESSEMAVRGIIREAALQKLGYVGEEDWIPESGKGVVFGFKNTSDRPLSDNDKINRLIGGPNFTDYPWHNVAVWDFGVLKFPGEAEPLINLEFGILLFADEVETLNKGEAVTTLHSSGFDEGSLVTRKEAFGIIDGRLHRVRAMVAN